MCQPHNGSREIQIYTEPLACEVLYIVMHLLRNVESHDEVKSLNNNECANLHSNVHGAQHGVVSRGSSRYAGQVATASEQSAIASKSSIESGEIVGILEQMMIDCEEDLAAAQDLNWKTLKECVSIKALKGSQIALIP